MKYKVGDKVRIRKDLIVGEHYDNRGFVNSMSEFLGKETIIRKVLEEWKCYNLEIDNGRGCWNWTDGMLEPSTEYDFKVGDKVIIKPGRECSKPGVFTIHSIIDSTHYKLVDDPSEWHPNNFIKVPVFNVGQIVTFKNIEDDRWPHSAYIEGELGMIALIDMHFYAPNKPGEDGNRYHVRSLKTGVCWHVTSASLELVPTIATLDDIKVTAANDPGPKGDIGIVTTAEALAQAVDNVKAPQFKIGDKVVIRDDLVPRKYKEWDYSPEDGLGGWEFAAAMAKYMGKVATITGYVACDPNYYHLDIDKGTYSWIVNALLPYTPGSDYDLDKTVININQQKQNKQNDSNQLQRKEEPLIGGCECTGTGVCYPGKQAATGIRHLGYRKVTYKC